MKIIIFILYGGVVAASTWYLSYLVTYYFTFIYTTINDSIIGGIATCYIKERCLCPSVLNCKGFHFKLFALEVSK